MIISTNAFYACCVGLIAIGLISMYYSQQKTGGFKWWSFIMLLLIVPFSLLTPAVYDVKGCDDYSKEILIFPKEGYSLGRYSYVINNSDRDIYLKTIVFGDGNTTADEDITIEPGTHYRAEVGEIHYPFKEIPESIIITNKPGDEIRYSLSCK